MIPALALAALALCDATLCGYRDAAGRNPRIHKEAYFVRAATRGLRGGISVVVVIGALMVGALLTTQYPAALWFDASLAASRMVTVYGIYACIVFAAISVWLVARADVRTLATVMILGPFTLIRPWVIAGGAVWAAWLADRWQTQILAVVAGAAMIAFENGLALVWTRDRRTPAVPFDPWRRPPTAT
jgi:hypothetical protein